MGQNGQDRIAAFDAFFTNNHIQKLKILLPVFDRSMQKNLAVYIKYLELQHTLSFFRKNPDERFSFPYGNPSENSYANTAKNPFPPLHQSVSAASPQEPSWDIGELCDALLPYCTVSEQSRLNSMRNMVQALSQYKEMMEMMQMLKELFPEGTPDPDAETASEKQQEEGSDQKNESAEGNAFSGGMPFNPALLSGLLGIKDTDAAQMLNLMQALNTVKNDESSDKGGE